MMYCCNLVFSFYLKEEVCGPFHCGVIRRNVQACTVQESRGDLTGGANLSRAFMIARLDILPSAVLCAKCLQSLRKARVLENDLLLYCHPHLKQRNLSVPFFMTLSVNLTSGLTHILYLIKMPFSPVQWLSFF